MGQIEDLSLFVDIVDQRSITKAAEKLNVAKSAVSRRLSMLESRYETKLIDRVPGTWAVTETGQELYQRAVRAILDMDELESDFTNPAAELSGPLSVSVPRDFGLSYLDKALLAFKRDHPGIALSIDFEDRIIDLDRENYDFAIRITGAKLNDLFVHRIGSVKHALYASSDYLEHHGVPTSIDDLQNHQLISYGSVRRASWEFIDEKNKLSTIKFRPFLSTNSGQFLLRSALDGSGIARLPDFILHDADNRQKLVEVLPETIIPEWGIYLLFSDNRRLNRRMKLFLDEMKKACKPINTGP